MKNIKGIERCIWKEVSITELMGSESDDRFKKEKGCHTCNGYQTDCVSYQPKENMEYEEETKK